jgi:hypothetical protein
MTWVQFCAAQGFAFLEDSFAGQGQFLCCKNGKFRGLRHGFVSDSLWFL